MRRFLSLALAVMILSATLVTVAQAESRRTRAIQRRSTDAASADGRYSYAQQVRMGAEVPNGNRSTGYAGRYPKFQGGFHSRQMQDIGVPTGDQGLRGNGFQMYPW
ncbi:MAG: hypothetical protein U0939_01965 [Pirellulales bacterium]